MFRISTFLFMFTGCAGSRGPTIGVTASLLTERLTDNGLIEQQIDLNGDMVPDVYNYYRERSEANRLLVRKEVDLNLDSKIDVRTWFTDEGTIEREEMDGDFSRFRKLINSFIRRSVNGLAGLGLLHKGKKFT